MPGAYHWGSLAVQERVGVRELAEHVGRSIGTGIRDVAAAFLELQPHLVVGAADGSGRLWASLLTGAPGFVRATGPDRITVAGGLPPGDPLTEALATAGTRVGTIALDPRTRRRMRLNGTLETTGRGFAVLAEQVFANCPKYLQKRQPLDLAAEEPVSCGAASPSPPARPGRSAPPTPSSWPPRRRRTGSTPVTAAVCPASSRCSRRPS